MHGGLPHHRRRARAIALAETASSRRAALLSRIMLAVAGGLVMAQSLLVAHSYLVTAHP